MNGRARDAVLLPAVGVMIAMQLTVIVGHVVVAAVRAELDRRHQADRLFAWFDDQFRGD